MKTHLDVLRNIDPGSRARLQDRSDVAGLTHLVLYLSVLTLSSIWIYSAGPLWGVGLLLQGLLIVFLFTLQHECTHDTPFASKWINRFVGHFCGFLLIQPFNWFRYFHLAHHRFTNDPERDPELLSGAKPQTLAHMIWHVSGLPFWRSAIALTLQNATNPVKTDYLSKTVLSKLKREARWMCLGYAVLSISLFWSPAVLWFWLLPALIGQPFLRLYLLAEHGRCPFVANMLENTRTTYTNRLVRLIAWNMPYHIEHHSAPNVPFHRLPELHKLMKNELITTAPGYAAFTKEYASRLNSAG